MTRAFHFYLAVILSVGCCCGVAEDKVLVADRGWFIAADDDGQRLLYFEPESVEPDEYIGGQLFIFDSRKGESAQIGDQTYTHSFVGAAWSDSCHCFYVTNGRFVFQFSEEGNIGDTVYRCGVDEIIYSMAVGKDGSSLAIDMMYQDSLNQYQKIMWISPFGSEAVEVYNIVDSSLGEDLRNYCLIDCAYQRLWVNNMYGALLAVDLKNGEVSMVDQSVIQLCWIDSSSLYYVIDGPARDTLCRYDLVTDSISPIIGGEELELGCLAVRDGQLVAGLGGKLIAIADDGSETTLAEEPDGVWMFAGAKAAVFQRENALYLYEMK